MPQSEAIITAQPDSRYPFQFRVYADSKPIGMVHKSLDNKFYAQYSRNSFGPKRDQIEAAMDDMGNYAIAQLEAQAAQAKANDELFEHMTKDWGHTKTPSQTKAKDQKRPAFKIRSDGKKIPISYGQPAPAINVNGPAIRRDPTTARTSDGRVLSID